MQTQQLQQNMKEKVKVFEDGGIRLLKKGQKGLVHAIFSRFGLVLVLLLLQFGALFSLLRWFGQLLPHYLGGTALVTAAMVIYLLNIDMDNSVRITWLVVIAVLPVLGVPLFWYTKADIGHNALKKRLMDLESQTRAQLPQPEGVEQRLEADSPGAASLARYLRGRGGGFPVYGNTAVTYFNGGEAKFAELLGEELEPNMKNSTKENLAWRVDCEYGATAGKFELAACAKKNGLDAIHDTVHEMARDEARHGRAFAGLLKRYFGK